MTKTIEWFVSTFSAIPRDRYRPVTEGLTILSKLDALRIPGAGAARGRKNYTLPLLRQQGKWKQRGFPGGPGGTAPSLSDIYE